jgi:hypothetical protein
MFGTNLNSTELYLPLGLVVCPEDGGNAFLLNVGKRLPEYTASLPEDYSPQSQL